MKEYKGAIRDYNKAIAIKPQSSEAYLCREFSRQCLLNYEDAVEDYNKALEINDPNQPGWVKSNATKKRNIAIKKLVEQRVNFVMKIDKIQIHIICFLTPKLQVCQLIGMHLLLILITGHVWFNWLGCFLILKVI